MIVSSGQQRDSAIPIHVSILPKTPLPSRLQCNIEQSSLCYTVGPCWLSILNIAVFTCLSQTLYLSFPPVNVRSPSPWVCFLFFRNHFFLDSAIKGCCMTFLFVWLTSLSMTISRSIHVAANAIISFFLMAEQHSIVSRYHVFFILSSVDGHSGCSSDLATVNSASVNTGGHVSFWTNGFLSICPGVGLRVHMIVLLLGF